MKLTTRDLFWAVLVAALVVYCVRVKGLEKEVDVERREAAAVLYSQEYRLREELAQQDDAFHKRNEQMDNKTRVLGYIESELKPHRTDLVVNQK